MRNRLSGCVLAATSVAGLATAASGARPGLAASPAVWRQQLAADPTGAVGLAASTLLWLVIGLVALGVAATVLGRLPGAAGRICDAVSRRLLPAVLRRSVQLVIGVTVGVSALAPSGAWAATPAGSPHVATTQPAAGHRPPQDSLPSPYPALGEPAGPVRLAAPTSPLPRIASPAAPTTTPPTPSVPTTPTVRPAPTAPPARPATATKPTPGAAEVVVVPGDSLWTIAARALATRDAGRSIGAASIAAEWPRWWAANRAAIGADPDLLIPGERLRPPA